MTLGARRMSNRFEKVRSAGWLHTHRVSTTVHQSDRQQTKAEMREMKPVLEYVPPNSVAVPPLRLARPSQMLSYWSAAEADLLFDRDEERVAPDRHSVLTDRLEI